MNQQVWKYQLWTTWNVDASWDLERRNGRFVRFAIEIYGDNDYLYVTLFKMVSTRDWIRVNQMSLTLEEFSAMSAWTGSVNEDLLGHAYL